MIDNVEEQMTKVEWLALVGIGRSMLVLRKGVYDIPKDHTERYVAIEELRTTQAEVQKKIERAVGFQTKGSWWNLRELMKLDARVQHVLMRRRGWVKTGNTVRPQAHE
jgi:hypothetical protein